MLSVTASAQSGHNHAPAEKYQSCSRIIHAGLQTRSSARRARTLRPLADLRKRFDSWMPGESGGGSQTSSQMQSRYQGNRKEIQEASPPGRYLCTVLPLRDAIRIFLTTQEQFPPTTAGDASNCSPSRLVSLTFRWRAKCAHAKS